MSDKALPKPFSDIPEMGTLGKIGSVLFCITPKTDDENIIFPINLYKSPSKGSRNAIKPKEVPSVMSSIHIV